MLHSTPGIARGVEDSAADLAHVPASEQICYQHIDLVKRDCGNGRGVDDADQ
ncbi:hypothetical protein [Ectopseudomonas oleovorans]|uniref:Uncharacterized protein n=1 Tax=Ectopseudomonas oleovorans TaxID=301 RepID=A0AA42QFU4_ECTOL|nr:hypothetical protein [Pseudomonas oleovorans]MDH1341856.1 hypothetical protein [Pseudomonas oleovorans]MDH1490852.1 hypothetical protein [Pseudomonas oleovorans]WGG19643.1 hypothetical protein N5O83_14310 [Pseudomonas oleovorans]